VNFRARFTSLKLHSWCEYPKVGDNPIKLRKKVHDYLKQRNKKKKKKIKQ